MTLAATWTVPADAAGYVLPDGVVEVVAALDAADGRDLERAPAAATAAFHLRKDS